MERRVWAKEDMREEQVAKSTVHDCSRVDDIEENDLEMVKNDMEF